MLITLRSDSIRTRSMILQVYSHVLYLPEIYLQDLPHGIPELIHQCATDYGVLDFKVTVTQDAIDLIHNLYINSDNHIFDMLPATLCAHIELCYDELGACINMGNLPSTFGSIATKSIYF